MRYDDETQYWRDMMGAAINRIGIVNFLEMALDVTNTIIDVHPMTMLLYQRIFDIKDIENTTVMRVRQDLKYIMIPVLKKHDFLFEKPLGQIVADFEHRRIDIHTYLLRAGYDQEMNTVFLCKDFDEQRNG